MLYSEACITILHMADRMDLGYPDAKPYSVFKDIKMHRSRLHMSGVHGIRSFGLALYMGHGPRYGRRGSPSITSAKEPV
jgi:hypothetical protein